jgi:glycosyltransferase involved in cell wall biosynthesis
MKISIVIPHFNRANLLTAALASLRAQRETSWEALVVDDGSEPEQWESTKAMAGTQVQVLQRRDGIKGPSRCRNLGLGAARGEYVLFLDSDDLLAPWCLEQRLRAALGQPEADLWVFPVLLFVSNPGDSDLQWNLLNSPRADLDRFLQSDPPWHTSSPLWRREKLLALGGFNEAVCYGDDADLHIRALVKTARIQKFPKATPDAFVRRGAEARITNTMSSILVESRRVRLEEGNRFLHEAAVGPTQLKLWEGQYFVEAEFLLFNACHSEAAIHRLLADWHRQFQPSLARRSFVTSYFRLAIACRRKAYLLLRMARRLAMQLLPGEYFPRGGAFQSGRAAPEVMQAVRERLNREVEFHHNPVSGKL